MQLPQWIGRRSSKSKQLLAARRRRDSKRLGFESLEDRSLLAAFVSGSIQGQDGWSGGTIAIPPQVVQAVDQSGTNAHAGVGAWQVSNSTANGGYNGNFSGWPFGPGLAVSAGQPSSGAAADRFSATYFFKSGSAVADGSNIEVDLGTTPGDDRNTFMAITNRADADGGLQIRMAESDLSAPGFFFPTQIVVTGLTRGTWHRIDIQATFVDGLSNDTFQVSLDGGAPITNTSPGSPRFGTSDWGTFEGFRDGNSFPYALSNRLFYRSGAAPSAFGTFSDTGAAGIYFDDISYKNWNSANPASILASYAATFEPAGTTTSPVYVDDNWANVPVGTDPDGAGPATAFGYDAFSTIQEGVNTVAISGTVNVAAGTYAEDVTVDAGKTGVQLKGARAGVDARGRVGLETVWSSASTNNGDLLTIRASDVTVDGFTFDGLTTASSAIRNWDGGGTYVTPNLTLQNNIIRDLDVNSGYGITLTNPGGTTTAGLLISQNDFDDAGFLAVDVSENVYGTIDNNRMHVPFFGYGVVTSSYYSFPGTLTVSNNQITGAGRSWGIYANLWFGPATSSLNISGNTINADAGVIGSDNDSLTGDWDTWAINLWSINNLASVSLTNNTIGSSGGQFSRGINVWNALDNVSISGGSIANSEVGINVDATDPYYAGGGDTTVDVSNVSITGGQVGIRVRSRSLPYAPLGTSPTPADGDPHGDVRVNLSGGSITGATTGIQVVDSRADAFSASLNLLGGTTISGGATGLRVDGAQTNLVGNSFGNTAFSGQSGNYITLANSALDNLDLDARAVTFGGVSPAAMTSAQLVALENKILHEVDDATLGFVLTLDATPGTVTQVGSTLIISGTGDKDEIQIKKVKSGALDVSVRSKSFDFDGVFAGITEIVVYGYAGDDHIKLHKDVTAQAFLFGGFGKDHLEAGGGNSVLVGGAGDDDLKGGSGRNILIGGTGGDKLESKDGADILIGGTTNSDDDLAALDAILAEWESTMTTSLLDTSDVFDDGVSDDLKGGKGQDKFYADTNNPDKKKRDKVSGLAAGEVLIEL